MLLEAHPKVYNVLSKVVSEIISEGFSIFMGGNFAETFVNKLCGILLDVHFSPNILEELSPSTSSEVILNAGDHFWGDF